MAGPSNYPGGFAQGITIRGVPITSTNPGEVFWVNNSSVLAKGGVGGSDGNPGTYQKPFSTITYALTQCTENRGDIIVVMPGYTETVAAAAGEVWNVAGVAIIGLGSGSLKPTFTLTATASDINVTAADMSVYNVRFVSGVADQVHCLHVTGANFAVDHCEFMASAAATAILTSVITTATAYGFTFTNNTINMESSIAGVAVTDVAASGVETLADNSVIKGNSIMGSFTSAGIFNQTTAAEGCLITDNDIFNVGSVAAGGISVHANTTGLCARNMIRVTYATNITTLITAAAMGQCENYLNNATAETGGKLTASA